jgi:hypothetical protein
VADRSEPNDPISPRLAGHPPVALAVVKPGEIALSVALDKRRIGRESSAGQERHGSKGGV